MKIARVARCLPGYDHIDWYPSRSPHIVIVDTRRHDSDQHLVRGNVWYLHLLDLEGNTRLAQPVLAYDLRIHVLRNLSQWGKGADGINIFAGHGFSLVKYPIARS